MTLQQLREEQVHAHAAWKASPSAGTEEALRAASAAFHAAKRAAEEAAAAAKKAADEPARQARVAARMAEIETVKAMNTHGRVIARAYAWPRCGEGFPATAAEKAAKSWAVEKYGSLQAAMAAMEVYS